ncbi:SAM-dependent methyltransferase [Microbispora sp. RL4-1S]|uniref:SAM-dependent methyltransferase n=1 Tax=Microbispora oryzae TaxID=2806554 RepID=A0A941ALQ4_9ACTN|nr:SAM-dependent methyltransferase [Microbispora oryzae]MBP2707517.1 SAM-dependent methyltransferase [Microbispora oryzae]
MTGQDKTPWWVVDPSTPSVARIYDYYLGGKDNFASDRQAAEKIISLAPNIRDIARINRAFLGRVVRTLAESGIRQFLDIGTGLPTQENVHQVAQRVAPESRVVYVDNDPIVLVHARALLDENRLTRVVSADLRDPRSILDHREVRAHLDFDQPLAVLLLAVLHFITDDAECHRIVGTLRDALPGGSHLVISHGTLGDLSEEEMRQAREVYTTTPAGGATPRSDAQIRSFFTGFELLEPGLVPLHEWRPDPWAPEPDPAVKDGIGAVGAVGRLP